MCAVHLGDIKTNIAENRVKSIVSEPYQNIFNKVYQIMNSHVNEGIKPTEIPVYIENILNKPKIKSSLLFW